MGEYGVAFQNEPVDLSEEFGRQENHFCVAERLEGFDPTTASGEILWTSRSLKRRVSYHQLILQLEDYKVWEDLPQDEYEDDRPLPLDISFDTPRTVRLRLVARPEGCRAGCASNAPETASGCAKIPRGGGCPGRSASPRPADV